MTDELRAKFEAWRDSLPEKYLARYDLSACKLGWDAGRASRDAEVEALKRDAAMLDWSIDHARWVVHEHEAYVAIPVKRDADLSSKGMRRQAIDAAMQEGMQEGAK